MPNDDSSDGTAESTNDAKKFTPFLKWAGGKRWFVQRYSVLLPRTFKRYIEPFLGGGSVFFFLRPSSAILGDANPDVVAAYSGFKLDWKRLRESLRYHRKAHSTDHYYRVRNRVPEDPIRRASRMIYLNRTCFNGIYRVNREGIFNVPRGSKDSVILDTDDFEGTAALLRTAEIRLSDFEALVNLAQAGDFIFADPPYTVRHNLNGFVKYNETLFSWEDQERLAAALIAARDRGAKVVATNAHHSSVRALYAGRGFKFRTVRRVSPISASPAKRSEFAELVILADTNDDPIL